MAKKENYYGINKEAVERLVEADETNSPEVSEEEIAKYRGKKKFNIPNVLKVLLIKWWFNGAICFFFYLGLGTVLTDALDQWFVLGAALGILTDLLTNHLLRFIEKTEHENDKYMMVTTRKFVSLFLNIPYAFLLLYCVIYFYNVINTVYVNAKGVTEAVALPVGPVLFGLFYLGFDLLFILIKNTFKKIIADATAKK